jgi:hypothetical protein
MPTDPTACAAGCGRAPAPRSRHCRRHALRLTRYGHVNVMPLRDSEIRPFHAWVAAGFDRYADQKATTAALTLAERLLAFRPTRDFTIHYKAASALQGLADAGVSPRDVLIRVAVFYAFLQVRPSRFHGSQKAEDFALARLVLRLGPRRARRDPRPSARLLQFLGERIRTDCAPYALALLRRIEQDADHERALRGAAVSFAEDTP